MSNPSGSPDRRRAPRPAASASVGEQVHPDGAGGLPAGRLAATPSSVGLEVEEGVLDGVLHQLGQDHGQRRGHVGRHLAQAAGHLEGQVAGDDRVLGHPDQRGDDLVEGDLVARLPGQDLVDDGDRPDPALGLEQRHPPPAGRQPPGLQPEQRRDGLQVVLHPVVDLADGGVLGQQQPVEAADIGDVAQQHDAAGHRRRPGSRGMQCRRTVTSGRRSTSSTTGQGRGQRPLDGRLLDAEVGEPPSLDLGVHAHPVQGVGGVGRGVADPTLLVDQHHPVADPGRLLGGHLLARERERPLGQHDGEAVEHVPVGALQVAGPPAGAGRQAGQHGHRLALAAHRDAVEPHRLALRLEQHLAPRRLAGLEGQDHQRPQRRRRPSGPPGRARPPWSCSTAASVRG